MRGDIQFARIDVKKNSRLKQTVLVFFGFILMSLLSVIAIASVRAYFTSTSTKSGTLNFGTVEVQVLKTNSAGFNAGEIATKYLTGIMPGSTIDLEGVVIKNSGDTSVYTLVNVDVLFTASDSSTLHYNKWYNIYGEEVKHLDFETNSTKATRIDKGAYKLTNIEFKVPGEAIDNKFKTGKTKITVAAYGTQTNNPEENAYLSAEEYAAYFICKNATQIATDNNTTYTGDAAVGEPLRQVAGKNLFDINNYVYDTQYGVLSFDISNLEIGQQYVLSSNKALTWLKISVNKDGYASVQKSGSFTSFAFTMAKHANIPHGAKQCISMSVNSTLVTDISQLDGYQIQIERGSTVTTYEAYSPAKDVFDIDTQTVTRNVGKYIITGDEAWENTASDFNEYSLPKKTYVPNIISTYALTKIYCSHFALSSQSYITNGAKTFRVGTNYINFNYNNSSKDLSGFKQWLKDQYEAGTPVTIWYQLATPTTNKALTSRNLYEGPQSLIFDQSGSVTNTTTVAGEITITKNGVKNLTSASYRELGGELFNYIFNKPITVSAKVKIYEDDKGTFRRMNVLYRKSDTSVVKTVQTVSGGMIADGEWHYYTVSLPAMSSFAEASSIQYVQMWLTDYSSCSYGHFEITDIQIEVGSAPTDFENYDQTEYQRVNNHILRRVGTAQDTYDASTKTITRNVSKTILDDTINYSRRVNTNTNYVSIYTNNDKLAFIAPLPPDNNVSKTIICSHLPFRKDGLNYYDRETEGIMGYSDYTASFMMTFRVATVGTTETSFKAWMNKQADLGTPLTIWYEVATPFEEYVD